MKILFCVFQLHGNQLDSYSAPPSDAFAPNHQHHHHRQNFQRGPPSGLIPPSGLYSVPSSGHYSGLGIQHGTITGNVRNLPINYNPPRQPVSFRAPVPIGLIESIGHSVQHADTFGFRLPQSPVYLPPGTGEIPRPPSGLEALPQQEHVQFNSNGDHGLHTQIAAQALPLIQPARFAGSDCSHGPNLVGTSQNIPALQSTYGVPNVALDVSQSGFEVAHSNSHSTLASSYDPPASGVIGSHSHQQENVHEVHEPSSSYGPPPSGNPADSLAFDTELKSSAVAIDSSTKIESSASEETNASALPGLDGAGLDIVSAKKSNSVEIPIQGTLGAYSLQFQAADPLGSQNNEVDGPDHKQLLSEGLLQSILSAIEQPNSKNQFVAQSSQLESIKDHQDVDRFIRSRVGQETLSESEPKTE